jgi:single-stranded-DNA-specific exonuclease
LRFSSFPLRRYSDLVAVGTVADVMDLTGENRVFVTEGLRALRAGTRPGFSCLLQEAGINAAGRMASASPAVELLMEEDVHRAKVLAEDLCRLNDERKAAERDMYRTIRVGEPVPELLILSGEGWHAGVAGIVAARLSEAHNRSVVLICVDGETARGTARGLPGIRLSDLLAKCAPLLLAFGGHDLAAGFSVETAKIGALTAALREAYTELAVEPPPPALEIDAEITAELLTQDQVRALDALEPTGQGNPKPVLMLRGVRIDTLQAIGKDGGHTRIAVNAEMGTRQSLISGVWFGVKPGEIDAKPGDRVDVAFTPDINEFRGKAEVQLKMCGLRRA